MSVFALPGKIRPTKYVLEWLKNVDKFRPSWSVAPKSQSITRFACHAAVRLPYDVKECFWIQEAIDESLLVWSITLLILLSVNGEIVSMFVIAQMANISINSIAGSWKTKQLDKVSAKVSKM